MRPSLHNKANCWFNSWMQLVWQNSFQLLIQELCLKKIIGHLLLPFSQTRFVFQVSKQVFFPWRNPIMPYFSASSFKKCVFWTFNLAKKTWNNIFWTSATMPKIFFLPSFKIQDSAIFRDTIFCRFFSSIAFVFDFFIRSSFSSLEWIQF